MDGRMDWRMVLVVAMGCLAGGCFHSDAHRSGYTDDGKFWQERVADHVRDDYINDLRDDILALGNEGEVDPDEAALLADTSVRYGMELAHQYRMVRPIEIHNTMVNLGLRKRGLCFQTAEDMYVRLRDLNLKTLQLHWGVAHKGDLWLEHSGVIVTARGRPFSSGLVLDAWRHSGRLRWAWVGGDRYPWVKMFKSKFPELLEEAEAETQLASEKQRAGEAQRTEPVYRIESRVGDVRASDPAAPEAESCRVSPAAESAGVRAPTTTASPPNPPRRGGQLSAIVTRREEKPQ
jgi:hypothetical protein